MNYGNIVSTVVGLVVGTVIGAAASYKYAEHKFEMILDEEMANYREYWRKREEKMKEDAADVEETDADAPFDGVFEAVDILKVDAGDENEEKALMNAVAAAEKMQEGIRKAKIVTSEDGEIKQKTLYNRIASSNGYTKKATEPIIGELKKGSNRPRLVTEEEYQHLIDDFSARDEQLFYDPETNHAWDEDGEPVEDIENTLGFMNLEPLDSGDADIVYIYNKAVDTVYVVEADSSGEDGRFE